MKLELVTIKMMMFGCFHSFSCSCAVRLYPAVLCTWAGNQSLMQVQVFALSTKGQPRHNPRYRSKAQISQRTHACLFGFSYYRDLIHLQLNPQEIPKGGDSHPKKHFVQHRQRFSSVIF